MSDFDHPHYMAGRRAMKTGQWVFHLYWEVFFFQHLKKYCGGHVCGIFVVSYLGDTFDLLSKKASHVPSLILKYRMEEKLLSSSFQYMEQVWHGVALR